MTVLGSIHTFTRRALQELPWDGARFGALFGYLSGLIPDSYAEGCRSVARMLVPLPETPRDALPHLLRAFGLPAYLVHDTSTPTGYAATLARMGAAAWATHSIAGSVVGLEAELATAGVTTPTIVPDADPTVSTFYLTTPDASGPPQEWGGGTWGDGTCYGEYAVSQPARQGIRAVMEYFRPARSRFTGVTPP